MGVENTIRPAPSELRAVTGSGGQIPAVTPRKGVEESAALNLSRSTEAGGAAPSPPRRSSTTTGDFVGIIAPVVGFGEATSGRREGRAQGRRGRKLLAGTMIGSWR